MIVRGLSFDPREPIPSYKQRRMLAREKGVVVGL